MNKYVRARIAEGQVVLGHDSIICRRRLSSIRLIFCDVLQITSILFDFHSYAFPVLSNIWGQIPGQNK